jgi:hypothetical protein
MPEGRLNHQEHIEGGVYMEPKNHQLMNQLDALKYTFGAGYLNEVTAIKDNSSFTRPNSFLSGNNAVLENHSAEFSCTFTRTEEASISLGRLCGFQIESDETAFFNFDQPKVSQDGAMLNYANRMYEQQPGSGAITPHNSVVASAMQLADPHAAVINAGKIEQQDHSWIYNLENEASFLHVSKDGFVGGQYPEFLQRPVDPHNATRFPRARHPSERFNGRFISKRRHVDTNSV